MAEQQEEAALPLATATLETLPIAEVTQIEITATTATATATATTESTAEENNDETLLPVAVATLLCANKACTNEGTKRCSRCKVAYYCSTGCQKSDWKNGHKYSCGDGIMKSKKNFSSSSSGRRRQEEHNVNLPPPPPQSSSSDSSTADTNTANKNNQTCHNQHTNQNTNNEKTATTTKIIPVQTRRKAQIIAKEFVTALQQQEHPKDDSIQKLFGIAPIMDNDDDQNDDTKKSTTNDVQSLDIGILVYHVWIEIYNHRLSYPSSSSSSSKREKSNGKNQDDDSNKNKSLAVKTFTADIAASLVCGKISNLFQELTLHVLCSSDDGRSNDYCMEMNRRGFDCIHYHDFL